MRYNNIFQKPFTGKLTIFFLMFVSLLFTQDNYHFEQISIPQGLSNNDLRDIAQDRDGFLWIATIDGLNRYDGYEFKVYKNDPSDPNSLGGNYIWTVLVDNSGRLWVGGNDVFALYDRENDNFRPVTLDKRQLLYSVDIRKIIQDSKGRIWVTTAQHGIHLLKTDSLTTTPIPTFDWEVSSTRTINHGIGETREGKILAGDFNVGLMEYNETSNSFESLDLPELINNFIVDIYVDEFGKVWITSFQKGLFRYNPNSGKLTNLNLFKNVNDKRLGQAALRIASDNSGFIWVGTLNNGLFRFNPVDDSSVHYKFSLSDQSSIQSNRVTEIFQDSFGILWFGTGTAGLNKVDPNKQRMHIYRLPEVIRTNSYMDRINAIAVEPDQKTAWLGTNGSGLIRLNIENGAYHQRKFDQNSINSIASNNILSLAIDDKGFIWASTDSSVSRLDPKSGKVEHYLNDVTGLTRVIRFNKIISGPSGRVYVAGTQGVDVLFPGQNVTKHLPSISGRMLDTNLMQAIKQITLNNDTLAAILKVGEGKNFNQSFNIDKPTKILVISGGEGRIYLGMFDYGEVKSADGRVLWTMSDPDRTFYLGGGLKNRFDLGLLDLQPGIYDLSFQSDMGHSFNNWNVAAPGDTNLWGIQAYEISDDEYNKLSKLYANELKIKNYMPLGAAFDIKLSHSSQNTLWIGSTSEGLFKYHLIDGTWKQYLFDKEDLRTTSLNDVKYVFEDSFGDIWFSTNQGLGFLDTETEEMKLYTESDGLPTNVVRAINEDNYGNIWISSLAGLTVIVRDIKSEEVTFVNLDIKDGLQGYTYSYGSWKDKDGRLYFSGDNGFNSFLPGKINQKEPKIVITDIRILEKSVRSELKDSPVKGDLNSIENIELTYAQNDIGFQFAPIHFSRPERNKIAYMLEGLHTDWVYSDLRYASFTNLDPGNYTFRIRAANGDGVWSKSEKAINLTVLPPWYRTWFAYAGYLLLFFGILFGFRKIELSRKMKNAMIKESELKAKAAELQAKAAEAQNRAIQAENERKTKELEEARALQLSMLPRDVPQVAGYEIAVYMKTATEVGGDYYDFSEHENKSLNIAIGDATGHGMKAGTMVASMKSLFTANSGVLRIDQFFNSSNIALKKMQLERVMMGLAMLQVNGKNIQLINAGMPPVFHYHQQTKKVEEIKVNGMPLGAMEKSSYEQTEISLAKGDSLLLLSDGMPELRNENDEMFGYERLVSHFKQIAEKSPAEIIEYLQKSGSEWVNDADPDDDVTFVVIKAK